MLVLMEARERATGSPVLRVVLAIALLLVIGVGILSARLWPDQMTGLLTQGAATARNAGLTGWVAAAVAQLLIALCGVLPASVGALTAGMAFGIGKGFVLSGSATLLAAVVGFSFSRAIFRPLFSAAVARRPRIHQLDLAVSQDGWRLVALLRISPIMPFAMTSYALGLTSLSLRDYMLGSLAALPALLGYVVLGTLTSAGLASISSGESQPLQLGLLAFAIAATALLTLRLARILRMVVRLPHAPVVAVDGVGVASCAP